MIECFNEDCLQGMVKRLDEGAVSVIVTSPPYNLGIDYGIYDDHITREKYLDWLVDISRGFYRVLAEDGSIFLNMGSKPTDPMVPFDVLNVFLRSFELQNVFHWIKSISVETEEAVCSYGHYKPINSPRFVNDCHEYIFHLTKHGKTPLDRLAIGVPYKDKANVERWGGTKTDARCRGNCWFIPYETIQSRDKDRPHPATFPAALPELCMKVHGTQRIKLALDPFLGLGNSAIAAQKLGVPFLGFEIDPTYYEAARGALKCLDAA